MWNEHHFVTLIHNIFTRYYKENIANFDEKHWVVFVVWIYYNLHKSAGKTTPLQKTIKFN